MILLPLIKRAQDNDGNAMLEIFRMFEPKLRRALSTVHQDLRDDFRQEVYIRIIKAVRKYNLNSSPDLIEFINNLRNRRRENGAF